MFNNKNNKLKNYPFIDSAILNNNTYINYLDRLKRVATSIFEWVNLPTSMNPQFLENTLFYEGMACFLKDKNYGFINTHACPSGNINIYDLPTKLNCYSNSFSTTRSLYTGLNQINSNDFKECILVQNNFDRIPTIFGIELFAYRLYNADRTIDVNITSQKTPIIIGVDEKDRLTLMNAYNDYNGNKPFIFGFKKSINPDSLKAIKTDAPYIADKVMAYKKEIWNEVLTFLGINNINIDKKERLITNEADSNNELINLNLQASFAPRQQACKEFNEKFGLTGTDKEISVRLRSDLHNIIKNTESLISDYINKNDSLDNMEEGVTDG